MNGGMLKLNVLQKEDYFIDHKKKVAVCGDWFINSRVEGAFLKR